LKLWGRTYALNSNRAISRKRRLLFELANQQRWACMFTGGFALAYVSILETWGCLPHWSGQFRQSSLQNDSI